MCQGARLPAAVPKVPVRLSLVSDLRELRPLLCLLRRSGPRATRPDAGGLQVGRFSLPGQAPAGTCRHHRDGTPGQDVAVLTH